MAPANRVTSVLSEPNKDGDNVIGITLGDGSVFDVAIDPAATQLLVEILQRIDSLGTRNREEPKASAG